MFKPKARGGMSGLTNAYAPPTMTAHDPDPGDRGVPMVGRKPTSADRQQMVGRRAALLAKMKGC